jgi:serine-type D-Ala-D-Ala carboxypeptidase (penicillin-binding protein 5/6)
VPDRHRTLARAIAAALVTVTTLAGNTACSSTPATPAAAPPVTAALAIPAGLTISGTAPGIPWPASGQAGLYIKGIGDFGRIANQQRIDTSTATTGSTAPAAPIASVAKIMTAYLTLRAHPLTAGEGGPTITVTAADAAAYPRENAQGQSLVRVKAGERLTERQALTALMLPSANNMARILGRWVAGSVENFLTQMNGTAAALCMTGTRYTDPSGFDPGTVSTADDQIRLAEIALTIPALAQIVATRQAAIPVEGDVRNVNKLLGKYGIDGVKTGSMSAAGGNLVFTAAATIGATQIRIIGAVLNQNKGLAQAFAQSEALVLAARAAVRPYPLIKAGQLIATTSAGTPLRAVSDLTVLGWPGLSYRPTITLTPGRPATATLTLNGAVDTAGDPAAINLVAG